MALNKRHLHHAWRFLRHIKPLYFLLAAILCGLVCVMALRHNNEHMISLRNAVYTADEQNGDVEGALRNLRIYVYNHMNTSLASGPNAVHPPVQLKYTYERLEQQQADILGKGNSALYQQAQAYCDAQTQIGSEVIACIQQYANDHGGQLAPVPEALYKFDFTSAKWSPDLAGWMLVLTVVFALAFLVSAPYHWWAKRYL